MLQAEGASEDSRGAWEMKLSKVLWLMPMMMEQFSCAAGDVAQSLQTPVTGTLPLGHFLVHIRFIWSWQTDGNSFFKL